MCSFHNRSERLSHILKLLDYSHPLLRQVMEPVSFPLSEEDQQVIHNMKYSIQTEQLRKANAPWDSAAGMAANQWGINKRIFLFCPEGDAVNNLQVIINPSYAPIVDKNTHKADEDYAWEGCFSVPLATGKVKRYIHIQITYQNEMGEIIHQELSGWPARVWQHETDHLNGFLYDDSHAGKCIEKHQFASREEIDAFYKKMRA